MGAGRRMNSPGKEEVGKTRDKKSWLEGNGGSEVMEARPRVVAMVRIEGNRGKIYVLKFPCI